MPVKSNPKKSVQQTTEQQAEEPEIYIQEVLQVEIPAPQQSFDQATESAIAEELFKAIASGSINTNQLETEPLPPTPADTAAGTFNRIVAGIRLKPGQ